MSDGGPAKGQLDYWYFDSYDLSPFLKEGENVVAAVVWNFGENGPIAQETWRDRFYPAGKFGGVGCSKHQQLVGRF